MKNSCDSSDSKKVRKCTLDSFIKISKNRKGKASLAWVDQKQSSLDEKSYKMYLKEKDLKEFMDNTSPNYLSKFKGFESAACDDSTTVSPDSNIIHEFDQCQLVLDAVSGLDVPKKVKQSVSVGIVQSMADHIYKKKRDKDCPDAVEVLREEGSDVEVLSYTDASKNTFVEKVKYNSGLRYKDVAIQTNAQERQDAATQTLPLEVRQEPPEQPLEEPTEPNPDVCLDAPTEQSQTEPIIAIEEFINYDTKTFQELSESYSMLEFAKELELIHPDPIQDWRKQEEKEDDMSKENRSEATCELINAFNYMKEYSEPQPIDDQPLELLRSVPTKKELQLHDYFEKYSQKEPQKLPPINDESLFTRELLRNDSPDKYSDKYVIELLPVKQQEEKKKKISVKQQEEKKKKTFFQCLGRKKNIL